MANKKITNSIILLLIAASCLSITSCGGQDAAPHQGENTNAASQNPNPDSPSATPDDTTPNNPAPDDNNPNFPPTNPDNKPNDPKGENNSGNNNASAEIPENRIKPNILIFMADDLTYTDIGPYGNKDVITPNLNEFAQQSLKFNYAFDTAAMCAPTRMALYSGLQPVRNGGHPNHSRSYDDIRSMPNYLRPLGYRVAIMGKRHESPQKNYSFDYLGGKHSANAAKASDTLDMNLAEQFISETDGPWALVLSSLQPHQPWDKGNAKQYDAKKIKVPNDLVDTPETRSALTKYYAEITFMDNQFGKAMQILRDYNQEENTLVLFLTEQGSNFPFAKWTLYDAGQRAGILARWPGITKGNSETNAMVQYVDILPTLLEAAGLKNDFDLDGTSFVPTLLNPNTEHRQYAYGIQTTNGIISGSKNYAIRSIRNKDYRLIWNIDFNAKFSNVVTAGSSPYNIFSSWKKHAQQGDNWAKERSNLYVNRPEFELYDMRNSLYEFENLADDPNYQSVKDEMFTALTQWMQQQGDKGKQTEAAAGSRTRDASQRLYPIGIPKGGKELDIVL